MLVSEILAHKGREVFTTTTGSTINEVASVLASKKIGAAVILNDASKVCGIVSERDIVREIAKSGSTSLDQEITCCMTSKVISCSEDDSVDDLMEKMTQGRFRHVPVINNENLVGLISIGDVVKIKIEQAEHEAEEMKRYIAG